MLTSLCALALLLAPADDPTDEVETRLVGLTSPLAAERSRAERWLSVHAGREHFPLLAEAAESGDAEVRHRIARIVGAEDAKLGLAVLFLRERSPDLVAVGEIAIAQMLSRWSVGFGTTPLVGAELAQVLQELFDDRRPWFLRVDLAAPLAESVDRLARLGGLPLGLALDPALGLRAEARLAPAPAPFVGTWNQVVFALAAAHGVGLEAIGIDRTDPRAGGGVLRLTRREREGTVSGAATVAAWCRGTTGGDGQARAACARALGRSGWPPALGWLAARWSEGADAAALDGVLVAAGEGRLAPELARAAAVRELVARADAALAADRQVEADRLLHALAGGACRGTGGGDLAAVLLEGWDTASPAGCELRLAALEGMGCVAAAGWREPLLALLAAEPGTHSPALLRQGLRAWVAVFAPAGAAPPTIGAPLACLGGFGAWDPAQHREVARLLLQAGCRPPDALRSTALPGFGPDLVQPRLALVQLALVQWWGACDGAELDLAARHLLALGSGGLRAGRASGLRLPDETAELLREWSRRGDGARALALIARARAAAGDDAARRELDRIALLGGILSPERHAEFLAAAAATRAGAALLGALAGRPDGESAEGARAALLERLDALLKESPPVEQAVPLIEAFERSLGDLYTAGADDVARSFRRWTSMRIHAAKPSALRDRLWGGGWPPDPPARDVRDLELLDRTVR